MYHVVFSKEATKDAKKLRASGLAEKAKKLVEIVSEDPFAYPPAFEPLVGNLSGLYSRRINRQHRFVYEVIEEATTVNDCLFEGTIKVLSMWTHYETL